MYQIPTNTLLSPRQRNSLVQYRYSELSSFESPMSFAVRVAPSFRKIPVMYKQTNKPAVAAVRNSLGLPDAFKASIAKPRVVRTTSSSATYQHVNVYGFSSRVRGMALGKPQSFPKRLN